VATAIPALAALVALAVLVAASTIRPALATFDSIVAASTLAAFAVLASIAAAAPAHIRSNFKSKRYGLALVAVAVQRAGTSKLQPLSSYPYILATKSVISNLRTVLDSQSNSLHNGFFQFTFHALGSVA
jgi:cytochrome bd-type quinol oxidase subunit 2